MAGHRRAELALDAWAMALWHRQPDPGMRHHSDHGSQYTSLAFGQRCQGAGRVPSRGSVGDCYDHALAASFCAALEYARSDHNHWQTQRAARRAVCDYSEAFYHPRCRHAALGSLSPAEYERRHAGAAAS